MLMCVVSHILSGAVSQEEEDDDHGQDDGTYNNER
jgi:hypothetical protein